MKYFTEDDIYYFRKGEARNAYEFLGCTSKGGKRIFSVWAPDASEVSLIGDFNEWNPESNPMEKIGTTGIWSVHAKGTRRGMRYKYHITGPGGNTFDKADPYAFFHEEPPGTASVVYSLPKHDWNDGKWMETRKNADLYHCPVSIYELHSSSFKKKKNGDILTWSELADELIPWVKDLGFTHIELMPVTEYPFGESWGYQVTGYYAPTARHGKPEGFKEFTDRCHTAGIGVILDWVPGHFPKDAHGLWRFDGTPLYEHADPRLGEQPQWDTAVFDYTREEVISFLISNALFWLREYHIDGLRVDAVSSILYRSFGRENSGWLPSESGGDENPQGIMFLRRLNQAIHEEVPDALIIAEESTAWKGITDDTSKGGLGFSYKWNMGWMNDILKYIETPFDKRNEEYRKLTFSQHYSFLENYILPFSHDEVIHGKLTMLDKMPGSYEEKFAGLRTLIGYMYAHPGLKLLFMGNEMAPFMEWRYYEQLEWHLLKYPIHDAFRVFISDLNHFYKQTGPLWDEDHSWDGFKWIAADDHENNILSFMRIDRSKNKILCVFNFLPVLHEKYELRLEGPKVVEEIFSSDLDKYSGSNTQNKADLRTDEDGSLVLKIPPLSALFFKVTETGKDIHKDIQDREVIG